MSDGEDTINSEEEIERTLLDHYNMLKGSNTQALFKVQITTTDVLLIKFNL